LEFLGRAALASISPTLLAEPDRDHKFLLHALNLGSEKVARRSIRAQQVFSLCQTLFKEFTDEDLKAALALVGRRNDELHSGASAFDEYPSKLWIVGFYRACHSLTAAMGESLETLLGEEAAKAAKKILEESVKEVRQQVERAIAGTRKAFQALSPEQQAAATKQAESVGAVLATRRHHRVKCPSCGSVATVQGEAFGPDKVINDEDSIRVLQSVLPHSLTCPACGLKLTGYAELDVAGLGGNYTRTTTFSPEDYYGLIDPESIDPQQYIDEYLADLAAEREWDNE
jgi:predicted RNA-binding Zn-ribbon protein involved in translation (DUF1610 family)